MAVTMFVAVTNSGVEEALCLLSNNLQNTSLYLSTVTDTNLNDVWVLYKCIMNDENEEESVETLKFAKGQQ